MCNSRDQCIEEEVKEEQACQEEVGDAPREGHHMGRGEAGEGGGHANQKEADQAPWRWHKRRQHERAKKHNKVSNNHGGDVSSVLVCDSPAPPPLPAL